MQIAQTSMSMLSKISYVFILYPILYPKEFNLNVMGLLLAMWNISLRPAMVFSPNFLDPFPFVPMQIRFFTTLYVMLQDLSSFLPLLHFWSKRYKYNR